VELGGLKPTGISETQSIRAPMGGSHLSVRTVRQLLLKKEKALVSQKKWGDCMLVRRHAFIKRRGMEGSKSRMRYEK
jgi:hypothetical protein